MDWSSENMSGVKEKPYQSVLNKLTQTPLIFCVVCHFAYTAPTSCSVRLSVSVSMSVGVG